MTNQVPFRWIECDSVCLGKGAVSLNPFLFLSFHVIQVKESSRIPSTLVSLAFVDRNILDVQIWEGTKFERRVMSDEDRRKCRFDKDIGVEYLVKNLRDRTVCGLTNLTVT